MRAFGGDSRRGDGRVRGGDDVGVHRCTVGGMRLRGRWTVDSDLGHDRHMKILKRLPRIHASSERVPFLLYACKVSVSAGSPRLLRSQVPPRKMLEVVKTCKDLVLTVAPPGQAQAGETRRERHHAAAAVGSMIVIQSPRFLVNPYCYLRPALYYKTTWS